MNYNEKEKPLIPKSAKGNTQHKKGRSTFKSMKHANYNNSNKYE